jgi:hypothetical protein
VGGGWSGLGVTGGVLGAGTILRGQSGKSLPKKQRSDSLLDPPSWHRPFLICDTQIPLTWVAQSPSCSSSIMPGPSGGCVGDGGGDCGGGGFRGAMKGVGTSVNLPITNSAPVGSSQSAMIPASAMVVQTIRLGPCCRGVGLPSSSESTTEGSSIALVARVHPVVLSCRWCTPLSQSPRVTAGDGSQRNV